MEGVGCGAGLMGWEGTHAPHQSMRDQRGEVNRREDVGADDGRAAGATLSCASEERPLRRSGNNIK
jgi:hypothetical protein